MLYSVFVSLLVVLSKSEYRCLGFVPVPPDGVSNTECRPVDIQLYTWSGPGFESGECWYQGHRFLNGAVWGRIDTPGAPYCVCEQGKVRVFYSQQRPQSPVADSLTILRPVHGSSPTSKDLAKWPIRNFTPVRQRSVICSVNRLGIRVRSRDGCTGCKCSKNGHWLCRKPPKPKRNRTRTDQQPSSRNNHYSSADTSNSVHIQLRVTTLRVRPQCPAGTTPQFCILIERLASSNTSDKASRYIEMPRETSWTDQSGCTRCSCTLDGRLTCEYLYATCSRSCLIQKTRPISLMYYFPPNSKWLTPPTDKCRSCMCVNGQRKCINCDQILKISIDSKSVFNNNDMNQRGSPIGEFRLLPAVSTSVKIKPCVLPIDNSSHQLILPGQQTWLDERCYFCSKRDGRLILC